MKTLKILFTITITGLLFSCSSYHNEPLKNYKGAIIYEKDGHYFTLLVKEGNKFVYKFVRTSEYEAGSGYKPGDTIK